jgi:hypothetical protein
LEQRGAERSQTKQIEEVQRVGMRDERKILGTMPVLQIFDVV